MAYDSDEENRQEFHAPRTVRDALRKYSEWRHYSTPNAWPSESAMYAALNGGHSTAGDKDGGMAARMDWIGLAFARHAWVLEMRSTLLLLPESLNQVIRAMYEVPQREDVKSDRSVAESLGISRMEAIKRLERAYGWLSRELGLPAN